MSLQGEQFERNMARLLVGVNVRTALRVVLSNLKGEGLCATLRTCGIFCRIVQLNSQDPTEGVRMGKTGRLAFSPCTPDMS